MPDKLAATSANGKFVCSLAMSTAHFTLTYTTGCLKPAGSNSWLHRINFSHSRNYENTNCTFHAIKFAVHCNITSI